MTKKKMGNWKFINADYEVSDKGDIKSVIKNIFGDMSKKHVGIIRNNGDVHTAQIGFHIGRVGVSVYVREYWEYKSWFIIPGVSVDAVNGYDRYVDIEAKILFVGIGIRFICIKRKVKR